ncbi:MAG: repeat containing protein [Cyanobacteria bacterium RYN_339]|nr:repeat containing protein [Cyanobacteria bacterium RYN_339]
MGIVSTRQQLGFLVLAAVALGACTGTPGRPVTATASHGAGTPPAAGPVLPAGSPAVAATTGPSSAPPTPVAKGGGIISDNGAGLVGTLRAPATLIGNNGGGIVSNHGGGFVPDRAAGPGPYRLAEAPAEVPYAGADVRLVDAAGNPVLGADGKPLATTSDAGGNYAFPPVALPHNTLVVAALPGGRGQLLAIAPQGAAQATVDVGLASSLTTGYILERYVKPQTGRDPVAVLDKLPADVERATRQQAVEALASGAVALPASLTPTPVLAAVEALRQQAPGLDTQLETVRKLLTIGSTSATVSDGPALQAQFHTPCATAADAFGNVYVADTYNNLIRKLTPDGQVGTLAGADTAGNKDGKGREAAFNHPEALAIDPIGNLYVVDSYNAAVRKVTPAGVVSTVARDLTGVIGIALGGDGTLYVGVDGGNGHIVKVAPDGTLTTLAGGNGPGHRDGPGATASFGRPGGLAVGRDGTVYVADSNNHLIRMVAPDGVVSTLAGSSKAGKADGQGAAASFYWPMGVALDRAGNLIVSELYGHVVRKVTPAGLVSTIAGNGQQGNADGRGAAAGFYEPRGLAVAEDGAIYVADSENNLVRKIAPDGNVTTVAGNGKSTARDGISDQSLFKTPEGVVGDAAGTLYVADAGNRLIRMVVPDGHVTTLAGSGKFGQADGLGVAASFQDPGGITRAVDGTLYVADGSTIRKVTPAGQVTLWAGGAFDLKDGQGAAARFGSGLGLAADTHGNLFVADAANNLIRKVDATGLVTTFAGSGVPGMIPGTGNAGSKDGVGAAASFFGPTGVAVDAAGNLYVSDLSNRLIRKITPAGVVTTLAGQAGQSGSADGQGPAARFKTPGGMTVDAAGTVYVADGLNNAIRKITPDGTVTTLATGFPLNNPRGVWIDVEGHLWVADTGNNVLRQVSP